MIDIKHPKIPKEYMMINI